MPENEETASDDLDHALAYGFSKDKRWKGVSCSTHQTQLDEVLVGGRIPIVRIIYFSSPYGKIECVFSAAGA